MYEQMDQLYSYNYDVLFTHCYNYVSKMSYGCDDYDDFLLDLGY